MFFTYVAIAGVSYLIGSLPTAYLLVKWKTRQDLREMGTGNIGALNSYEVTGSRFIGIAVLIVDLLKGMCSVHLARSLFGESFEYQAVAIFFAVFGHNYPIWLRFKGGRGLATAAGGVLLLSWLFVLVWCAVWLATYLPSKNVHKGNLVAIGVTPFVTAALASQMVEWGLLLRDNVNSFIFFGFLICALLFLRHIRPLREMFAQKRG